MTDHKDAWRIDDKDFPHNAKPAEKLAFCVRYAVLAPSTYNEQPWYFKIQDNAALVYMDRRYALPVIDPEDREMVMAVAGALFNLRLAIRAFGYAETTELFPDPEDEDLLARVKLGEKRDPEPDDPALFSVITKRHTNRTAFSDKEIPENLLRSLKSAATQHGCWLHICTPIEHQITARLIAEGDYIQMGSKNFRRELAAWAHPRRLVSGDGMAHYGAEWRKLIHSFEPSILRRFESDQRGVASDTDLAKASPVLAVLGSSSGTLKERVAAGQALMHVFLQAEREGLAISTLNQPCEVPELRLRFHDEMEFQGRAQAILRIGYGGKAPVSARRPIEQVLEYGNGTESTYRPANENRGFVGKIANLFLAKKK